MPFFPLLYLLGQHTRRKVGVLPGAAGSTNGRVGDCDDLARLFVLGESTVAGLGAATHETALTGQFALHLSENIGKQVEWDVVGRNGVTARRTLDELYHLIPSKQYDYILVGLGGNDVLKLSSPKKWRRDMTELLAKLRHDQPTATIFLSNCPMIKFSPAIPQPIKFLLWELSKMHDDNIKDLTSSMENVYYYPQPRQLESEGFFADGIHPSEKGYAEWSAAMMEYFREKCRL